MRSAEGISAFGGEFLAVGLAVVLIGAPGCAALRGPSRGLRCSSASECAGEVDWEARYGECQPHRAASKGCDALLTRLAGFGADAEPHLSEMLSSWDPDVRDAAVCTIARMKAPAAALATRLERSEDRSRCRWLAIAKTAAPGVEQFLGEQLQGGQCDAALGLAALGPQGFAALARVASVACCRQISALAAMPGAPVEPFLPGLRSALAAVDSPMGFCAVHRISLLRDRAAVLEPELRHLGETRPDVAFPLLISIGIRDGLSEMAVRAVHDAPKHLALHCITVSPDIEWCPRGALVSELIPLMAQVRPVDAAVKAELLAFLSSDDANERSAAAVALGNLEDPSVVPALAALVSPARWDDAVAALWALSKLGGPEAAAVREGLARSYWFSPVRRFAAGKGWGPACGIKVARVSSLPFGPARLRVTGMAGGPLVLEPLGDRRELQVAGGTLRAVDHGEWGGGGITLDEGAGHTQRLYRLNVSTFIERGSTVLALAKPAPNALPNGQLLRVVADSAGHWRVEHALTLPGEPLAWGQDATGALVIAGTLGVVRLSGGLEPVELPCERSARIGSDVPAPRPRPP